YKACAVNSGTDVAIKELFIKDKSWRDGKNVTTGGGYRQEFAEDRQRFLQEAETLRQLRFGNPNPAGIVDVRECFDENNTAYMVMEYVKGKSLEELVVENGGPLPEAQAVHILVEVANALKFVHSRNLLHRDVKPQNIIIRDDSRQPVLIDFSCAKTFQKGESQKYTRDITEGYSPLELYAGEGRFDCVADVYSLAATGFFALTGASPPTAVDLLRGVDLEQSVQFPSNVSDHIRQTIRWGMQMNVNERPETAHTFAQALLGIDDAPPTGIAT
ncbi:MAG: serine/threonine-protein kinase, partial [Armatimonadota bacterium]